MKSGTWLPAPFVCFAALFCPPGLAEGNLDLVLPQCESCHGAQGVAKTPGIPHLNAQNGDYLLRQIESLRSGQRSRTTQISGHIPAHISREDWAGLARHYAQANPERPGQITDSTRLARGEQTYLARCEACHLDEGRDYAEGKSPFIPRLAGQDLVYLLAQMQEYVEGKRAFAALQDSRFSGLDRTHFEDLAHFFASRSSVPPLVPTKKRRRR